MNYNNNFNFYIEELMNHIYTQKLYKLAYKLELGSIDNTDSNTLDKLIYSMIDILPDIDTEEIVRNFIDSYSENYYMRKAISIEKNYLYPKLFDNKGNPKKDYNYTTSLITLWKNDMDEFYIEEVYNRFSKESFIQFVKSDLDNLLDDIVLYVKDKVESNKIIIKCINKDSLLDTVKNMILDKSLGFEWAQFLVDMDSLRNEMLTLCGDLDIYSEYEKLEEDTKYCLDNHCKYDSNQLSEILTTKNEFTLQYNLELIFTLD